MRDRADVSARSLLIITVYGRLNISCKPKATICITIDYRTSLGIGRESDIQAHTHLRGDGDVDFGYIRCSYQGRLARGSLAGDCYYCAELSQIVLASRTSPCTQVIVGGDVCLTPSVSLAPTPPPPPPLRHPLYSLPRKLR